jgi:dihydrofolate reductase
VWLSLVPVFLGAGKPFFPDLADDAPLLLDGPDGPDGTAGTGVTYLRSRVRKG